MTVRCLKKLATCLFLPVALHFQTPTFAQTKLPEIIPPSPNAAAFSKYGNIPISAYTGVPNIQIPLYTIKVRDITVPISLSYHASGIKVTEEASRVGLGWVLNCGGVISRNIINKDDFLASPEAYHSPLNDAPELPLGAEYAPSFDLQYGTEIQYYNVHGDPNTPTLFTLNLDDWIRSTDHDFQPDQYNYNVAGHSGKFVLTRDREAVIEKNEKLLIEVIGQGDSWKVTTPDGFIYKFETYEYFRDFENPPASEQRSAWYLTKIISPQGEEVTFNYETTTEQYVKPAGGLSETLFPTVLSCENFSCTQRPAGIPKTIPGKNYSKTYLTSVVWDHGRIEFAYADDRLDLEGDIRLTSFSVFEKDADQARQVVEFNHEYFTSQNMGNEYATDRTPDVLKKRLKLVSVIKRPVPDPLHEEEKYSFRYYEGNESLPPKNSFAIDHWGYYNGRNSNASLIPSHKFFSSAVTIDDLLGVMGQERDPQAGYAKGFTLKEITYPTKGKTIFEYENNEFDAANVPPGTSDNPCQKETRVFYNGSEKGKVQTHYLDLTTQYVTAAGTTIPVELVAAFRAYGPCKDVVGFPKVYFELYQADGVSRISRVDLEMNNCATEEEKVCLYCDRGTQARSPVFTYRNTYALAPGKYIWKAYIPADDNQFADITANYIWWQTPSACTPVNEPDNTYKLAGGIRVSAVKDITPKETVNIKRYVYRYTSTEDGVTTTRSYGRRMSTPSYSYFDLNAEQQESGTIPVSATCLACVHLVRTSESTRSPFNSQGHSVGYDKVIELSGQNGEFGRTEYEYENRSDIFHNVKHWNDMPARPGTFSAYAHPLNGMLKSQTLFDANGDIVHKTTKTYEVVRGRSVYGLEERLAADINMVLPNFQLIAYRAMESNFIYESSSTEVSYVNNVPAAQTTTTFYYDNPRHLQLTRKVTTKSDLHQEITKIKYAADYSDAEADPAVLAMKSNDRYMHALPVEVSTIDQAPDGNQKVISQEITVYDHFGSFLFPKDKVLLSAQSPPDAADLAPYVPAAGYDLSLYRKVFSLDYDLNGNIRKVQKESDQPVTYLWGYGHNFPVAEIVGAEPEACFYSSFEDQGELYLDAAGKSIARTGTRVLTSSSYSFPASYTPDPASTVMSYWYWQNNAWQFSGIVPFQRTITHPGSRIDEVRAYPAKTMMKTYAYDPLAGITSLTDANNVTQHFEYDRMDRLKLVRNAEKEIVKAYHYRYRQDQ